LAVEHGSNQRVTTQSVKTETATIMGEPRKGGKASAFNRKPLDRRLVREVIFGARAPKYWTPMAIMEEECKLMEVRKFSNDYFNVDTKFRRPGLELINAFAVQNPFLWGQYLLRREQMKMQLVSTGQAVKEKDFFCKSEFDTFEATVRQNFDPRSEANPEGGVIFFTDPLAADDSKPDCDNIRIMIMTKVLVGTCVMKTEEEEGASAVPPPNTSGPSIHPKTDLPVDTITDSTKTRFYKFSMNEVYPEFVLVYRKKTGGKDTRSTQLHVKHIPLRYRTGARFNPQEKPAEERSLEADPDPDKIETAGVFAEESLVNVRKEDVKEGHKQAVQAVTKQPKRSRTGFKLSMFGLFGGRSQAAEEDVVDDEEGTKQQLMEE